MFLNDKMHGKGVYTIAERYVYEGDFYNDDIEGYGICTWLNGKNMKGSGKIIKWKELELSLGLIINVTKVKNYK